MEDEIFHGWHIVKGYVVSPVHTAGNSIFHRKVASLYGNAFPIFIVKGVAPNTTVVKRQDNPRILRKEGNGALLNLHIDKKVPGPVHSICFFILIPQDNNIVF